DTALRGDATPAQADGRDRRPPDPLAHHEDLLSVRPQRVRRGARLQGRDDQELLPELLPHSPRPQRPPRRRSTGHSRRRPRRLADPSHRHGHPHPDGRAAPASAAFAQGRDVHDDLRRRRGGRRHLEGSRLPSSPRQGRADDGRAAAPPGSRAAGPPPGLGLLESDGDLVPRLEETPQTGEGWINGGFFVLERGVLDYIDGPDTKFEYEPLERLAREGQLVAYRHDGFWQCMDTLRDVRLLESLWASGQVPWKVWA